MTTTTEPCTFLARVILDAAYELFERGGIPSMREVARRAGVGVGSIYDHFANRDALLDRDSTRHREHMEHVLANVELDEAMVQLGEAAMARFLDRGSLSRASARSVIQSNRLKLVTQIRDDFLPSLQKRVVDELGLQAYPAAVSASVMALSDMMVGLAISELHRTPDPPRRAALEARLGRAVRNEIQYLRSLTSGCGLTLQRR